jgi:acetylornithine deacetylase/succinyl-diaminopimelate desuccinylase-like protein
VAVSAYLWKACYRLRMQRRAVAAVLAGALTLSAHAQGPAPDWSRVDPETLQHFQALVRVDTSDPPGNEQAAVDYLKGVLEKEGIPVQLFTLEPNRPNLVARLRGSGRKRPILIMGHTDVVNVDPTKWTHPPFSAARAGGHIYGRGTVDDKDSVTAGLMVMLLLKRLNVALDRDVIFLAEAGEEGSTRVGIQFMVNQHFDAIDAEYCLAETGGVVREGGAVKYATVQTTEKIPRAIDLTARGVSGHGSVPLESNALVQLGIALARLGEWHPPVRLNQTSREYFARLAKISTGADAARYRDLLDPKRAPAAAEWLRKNDPAKAARLHATASPTMLSGGYRINVIPAEVKATVDVRLLPDDDIDDVLGSIRRAINNPAVSVEWAARATRPAGESRVDTEAFTAIEAAAQRVYATTTLPTMSTGATDMAFLRGKGVQCYGIGPAIDEEDAPKGFGAHSDQERILEAELYRFVRYTFEIVTTLAARG